MADINERMKPWTVSREELDLRFDLYEGKITIDEFNVKYEQLRKEGKIVRNGKAIK